jgi:signal transduction histidine kinase
MPVELSAATLPAEVRLNLFLVVKEALNDVLKHARAADVCVQVSETESGLQIVIEDNGVGFDPEGAATRRRNGLENMRKRIEGLGGKFVVVSAPGQGTRLTITTGLKPNPLSV